MFTFLRIVAATGFALVAIIVVLVALRMNNADQSTTLWTMPEGLRAGERGEMLESMVEALTTIADFDIDSLIEACDNVEAEL